MVNSAFVQNSEIIRFPGFVPYHSQLASPELAQAIFSLGMDPALDPHWRESGAETPEEYAYWVNRACGAACVQMAVEAVGGPVRPLIEWARRGSAIGGYLIDIRQDNPHAERGWLHSSLADLIITAGFYAEPRAGEIDQVADWLRAGMLLIASVSYEIGTDLPITRRGGHLVVVHGVELQNGQISALHLHNPSGRRAELRANTSIPVERFTAAFSGRVILAGLTPL